MEIRISCARPLNCKRKADEGGAYRDVENAPKYVEEAHQVMMDLIK